MRWVTVEGVNGVGKSHLIAQVPDVVRLAELPECAADPLTERLMAALGGDRFLRTGFPLAETFTLLGLAARRFELARRAYGDSAVTILEDRGVDTIAVYQAAILSNGDDDRALELALRLRAMAAQWRPPPYRTVLVVDDDRTCLARWNAREGRSPTPSERSLMRQASRLYQRLLQHYTIIDRRELNEQQAVQALLNACQEHP
ncbi:thymidylate kinase [Spongiactinospora gelatinilytica]|uniref:Thymidylate kinase n=1 Tax=Spongiactinospora gelatinilytica TaxID=2666298 RepID=A0A2W2G595_9ACTN|nr:thymidylate kinase [Spongiactinospora gelatinilytica]